MAISSAPYGAWTSAFTTDLLVSTFVGLGGPTTDGDDIYWTELRPTEGGRTVIVRRAPDGSTTDVIPAPFNARTRVHEYGGGAITYAGNGEIYFANFADQKLYRVRPTESPQPLTKSETMRYADGVTDTTHNRLICVREDHTDPDAEAVTTIVAIDLATGAETVLVHGHDFFSNPRLSPDGQLSWLAWDHPNMPWDGTTLFVASLDADGLPGPARAVAGGVDESVFQPAWSPDGTLYFVADRSGWWNLYRLAPGDRVERVTEPMAREFGEPQWLFGMTRFTFASATTIVCTYQDATGWHLATIDTQTGVFSDIDTPFTSFEGLRASDGRVLTIAASPTRTRAVVSIDLATGESAVLRRGLELDLDPGQLSAPQPIEFPTSGGLTAYGFFYPPRNDGHTAPEGEKPPLVVFSHGGPTSRSNSVLTLDIQFWTSRGVAVLDVNYGGSSGYGRAYRQRLNGNWGVVDMDDCVNGALHLVDEGRVDGDRLAIRGGSAGGYTTLCALTFRDVFKAGASHFGVGDLAALATDTHKFESRYLDTMVGPYPECAELYAERSPINHVDQLDCPVIFLQGMDDRVVPPAQAESMVAALRAKGVPVAYLPFEGEGHGFRKAENIKRATDAELSFYGRIFGFIPAGDVEPVDLA